MIVSALLTSVGINLGLCVLFFAVYSVLRKQPGNVKVYFPRLVEEGDALRRPGDVLSLVCFLPSTGWVRSAWRPSENELLSAVGFDAVVFMRIFIFSLKVFCATGFIGIFILLPVNYEGDQLREFDLFNITNESLDRFSISNVQDGSRWLWVHFSAAYVITGVVCYLLYMEFDYISSKKLEYFYASSPKPEQFTILVRGVPMSSENDYSDTVEKFFRENHPSTYHSHLVLCRTSKLHQLINDAESVYRKLAHLKSKHYGPESSYHGSIPELVGKNGDLIGKYGKELDNIEENVRLEQTDVTSSIKELPAAFVCFRSRYGAAATIHIRQSTNPTEWVTEQAPEPRDVYWPNFSASFIKIWLSKTVVVLASFFLTMIFLVPVAFVQGLANLDQLETTFPFLKSILTINVVSQVITGYLPSLILHTFLSIMPAIMKSFSTMQGYISHSAIERSACRKMLWFTIWNIFFASVLSGSIANQFEIILDPKNIPRRLAIAVPAQASFFISYVVTSGWTSLSSDLTRTLYLVGDFFRRHFLRKEEDKFLAPSISYHSEIPAVLFFGLLGITYSLLAPLILPFLLIYFCLGYVIYRNQLLNVYSPKYETGGMFWLSVHSTTIFSLILMQAIAIGIFGLKKLPIASTFTVPLPVFTFLFDDYCRKRFVPIFRAYSAESLIKKDRADQTSQGMADFLNNLGTAYVDPALAPIQFSENPNSRVAPLIS